MEVMKYGAQEDELWKDDGEMVTALSGGSRTANTPTRSDAVFGKSHITHTPHSIRKAKVDYGRTYFN